MFGTNISPITSIPNIVLPKIIPNGVHLPIDRPTDVNNIFLGQSSSSLLPNQKSYWMNYTPGIVSGINPVSAGQGSMSLGSYIPTVSLSSVQPSSMSSLGNFMNPLTSIPLQNSMVSLQNQNQVQSDTISLPSSTTTPLRAPSPKRISSPIDVETIEPDDKKHKAELENAQEAPSKFIARTTNMLPSLNNDLSPEVHHSCNQICQHQEGEEPVETHIIITARLPVPPSVEQDERMSTESDSDYDTNLQPKETPLQYKDRMIERAMKKNLASKRSREKRKREHERRQLERQKLEQRNIELASKLMELKETLNRLKPQICSSCNEQVQTFLDQHQKNDGMNIFVLRPCSKPDCRGNKNYNAGVKKTEV